MQLSIWKFASDLTFRVIDLDSGHDWPRKRMKRSRAQKGVKTDRIFWLWQVLPFPNMLAAQGQAGSAAFTKGRLPDLGESRDKGAAIFTRA
jgi:hypothetical protein